MRFKDRNFPYPVLDPAGRDVAGSAFQITFTAGATQTAFHLDVKFSLHNETLEQLIKEKRAIFVVHVDCNATFFRKAFTTHEPEIRLTIDETDVKRELGLTFFVCATESISGYSIAGMDDLYGDTKFQVGKGDVLAYAEPETYQIFGKDSLKKISSIMLVREGEDDLVVPYINYDREKIVLSLPKEQYSRYGQYKTHPLVGATMLTAVITPVLVDAVQKMLDAEEREEESEYSVLLWYRVLRHRVGELRLKNNELDNAYSLAQAIMAGVSEKAMREIEEMLTLSE